MNIKNRLKRKRIREEKQRLRRRTKPHKKRKYCYVDLELSQRTINFINSYADKYHISFTKAIRKRLKEIY